MAKSMIRRLSRHEEARHPNRDARPVEVAVALAVASQQAGGEPMRRVAVVATFLLVVLLPPPSALAQAQGPTVVSTHRLEFGASPGPFDLVQLVVDFAPGAETPPHVHGGSWQVTIVEGEILLRADGEETRFTAGEGFIETSGKRVQTVNASKAKTRLAMSVVLPKGAVLTTPVGTTTAAAPVMVSRHDREFRAPPRAFELVQVVQSFAPGAQTPVHSHGGHGQATVLFGDLEVRTQGQASRFSAGQGFSEDAGETVQVANVGSGNATMVMGVVLPKGKDLTISTATSGFAHTGAPATPLLVGVGFWLIAAGLLFRRNAASTTG